MLKGLNKAHALLQYNFLSFSQWVGKEGGREMGRQSEKKREKETEWEKERESDRYWDRKSIYILTCECSFRCISANVAASASFPLRTTEQGGKAQCKNNITLSQNTLKDKPLIQVYSYLFPSLQPIIKQWTCQHRNVTVNFYKWQNNV